MSFGNYNKNVQHTFTKQVLVRERREKMYCTVWFATIIPRKMHNASISNQGIYLKTITLNFKVMRAEL